MTQKQEEVFLAPESLTIPDFRDVLWLKELIDAPAIERSFMRTFVGMIFIFLVAAVMVWGITGEHGPEMLHSAFKPFLLLFKQYLLLLGL